MAFSGYTLGRTFTQPVGDATTFELSAGGFFEVGNTISVVSGIAEIICWSNQFGNELGTGIIQFVVGSTMESDPTPEAGDRAYVIFEFLEFGTDPGVTPASGWVLDHTLAIPSSGSYRARAWCYHYDFTGSESDPFGPYNFNYAPYSFSDVTYGFAFVVRGAALSGIAVTSVLVDSRTGTVTIPASPLTAPADHTVSFCLIGATAATASSPTVDDVLLTTRSALFFNPPPLVSDGATTQFPFSFDATGFEYGALQTPMWIFQIPPADESAYSSYTGTVTGVSGAHDYDQVVTATTTNTGGAGGGVIIGPGSYLGVSTATVVNMSLGASLFVNKPILILTPPDATLPYNQTLIYRIRKVYSNGFSTIPTGIFLSSAGTMDPADVTSSGQSLLTPYEQIGPYSVTFIETS